MSGGLLSSEDPATAGCRVPGRLPGLHGLLVAECLLFRSKSNQEVAETLELSRLAFNTN